MRVLCVLIAMLLASCSTDMRLAREAADACAGDNQNCSPELASHMTLRALRANGSQLVVHCEMAFEPVSARYREACQRQLVNLANELSAKWPGTIAPISEADISQSEFRGCIETLDRDIDYYGVQGKLPLRWLGN